MNQSEQQDRPSQTPFQTIEAVAKTMYKQAKSYGFTNEDFIRFVNVILDLNFNETEVYIPPPSQRSEPEKYANDFSINAPRLSIRRYKEEYFTYLKIWVEDPIGRQFLMTRTRVGEPDSLEALVKSENSIFGIVFLADKPIGSLAYLNYDREQRKAELRKLIADPAIRGKGYAKEATRHWIEYGVAALGLRKIYLHTLDTNLANIRLNEQLGFRVEGMLREECFFDGVYHDILRMGLIISEKGER